jgi:hypothetical protein
MEYKHLTGQNCRHSSLKKKKAGNFSFRSSEGKYQDGISQEIAEGS